MKETPYFKYCLRDLALFYKHWIDKPDNYRMQIVSKEEYDKQNILKCQELVIIRK